MVQSHGEICPKKHYFFEEEGCTCLGVRGADFCFCVQGKETEPQEKTINNFELNQLNCLSWGLHLDRVYFLAIIIMVILKKKPPEAYIPL